MEKKKATIKIALISILAALLVVFSVISFMPAKAVKGFAGFAGFADFGCFVSAFARSAGAVAPVGFGFGGCCSRRCPLCADGVFFCRRCLRSRFAAAFCSCFLP